jgi:hypothetical protein
LETGTGSSNNNYNVYLSKALITVRKCLVPPITLHNLLKFVLIYLTKLECPSDQGHLSFVVGMSYKIHAVFIAMFFTVFPIKIILHKAQLVDRAVVLPGFY